MRIITLTLVSLFCIITLQAQTTGTVYENKSLSSNILKIERKYSIYLPEGYESSDRTYPVLYLLHPAGPAGTIPNHQSWFHYGNLKHYLDKAVEEGYIIPMIVVTPDANLGTKRISYFNDPEGDFYFEDYFFKEFIPFIEQNYRCRTEKGSRAIAGASLGGAAALQYAIHQPDLFAVTCALSAAVRRYDSQYLKNRYPNISDEALMEWYKPYDVFSYFESLPDKSESKTNWYIVCGDDDHLSSNNALLHTTMKSKGIAHEFRMHNGAHDWPYWRSITHEFLVFVSDTFRK
ncbi:MAG: esterase family protein [Paludibacteraceae bacterium]|nr:esterase family protein [Paludibacteraceae bacterium]